MGGRRALGEPSGEGGQSGLMDDRASSGFYSGFYSRHDHKATRDVSHVTKPGPDSSRRSLTPRAPQLSAGEVRGEEDPENVLMDLHMDT